MKQTLTTRIGCALFVALMGVGCGGAGEAPETTTEESDMTHRKQW